MANRILYFETRPEIKSLIGINLQVFLGVELKIVNTLEQVKKCLEEFRPEIILAEGKNQNHDPAFEIKKILNGYNSETPLYSLGISHEELTKEQQFSNPYDIITIIRGLAKVLKKTATLMAAIEVPKFYPIPKDFLFEGFRAPVRIYKLENNQYHTVLYQNQNLSQFLLKVLQKEKHPHLYVQAEERIYFSHDMTKQLTEKFKQTDQTNPQKIQRMGSSFKIINQLASDLGIQKSTLDLAEIAIKKLIELTRGIPDLQSMIDQIQQDPLSLLSKRTLLSTYIAFYLLDSCDLLSYQQDHKLAFALFFKDICLPSEKHSLIISEYDPAFISGTLQEMNLVRNHALLSSQIIKKYPITPEGAELIIRHHHGSLQGKGLRQQDEKLHPIAPLIILSEEWANHMLLSQKSNVDFLFELKSIYPSSQFARYYPFFESINHKLISQKTSHG